MSSFTVQICDFTRSYVRWGIDLQRQPPVTVSHPPPFTLNHVRVAAECLAEVTCRDTGITSAYLLGASCKTERVNVEADIWTDPNADFCMVAGTDRFLALKRWDRTEKGVMRYPTSLGPQPERQPGDPRTAFTHYGVDVRRTAGRVIEDVQELAAIFATDRPVVSRTRVETPRYTLRLEYPVKTGNYSTREHYYQVDTGPVLLPDLTAPAAGVLESFNLAYVAHLRPGWAEFLVSAPTPLAPGIAVHHYSRAVRVECHNEMIAVGDE